MYTISSQYLDTFAFSKFQQLPYLKIGINARVILMLSLWIAFAIVNNRIVIMLLLYGENIVKLPQQQKVNVVFNIR